MPGPDTSVFRIAKYIFHIYAGIFNIDLSQCQAANYDTHTPRILFAIQASNAFIPINSSRIQASVS